MVVFYNDTTDGKLAAYLVVQHYGVENVECIRRRLGDYVDIQRVADRDIVWILDFGLDGRQLQRLQNKGCDIVWIDHHESNIRRYLNTEGKLMESIAGKRRTDRATCLLTWSYLHSNDEPPPYVRHVGWCALWHPHYEERHLVHSWHIDLALSRGLDIRDISGEYDSEAHYLSYYLAQHVQEHHIRNMVYTVEFPTVRGYRSLTAKVYNGHADIVSFRRVFTKPPLMYASVRYDGQYWLTTLMSDARVDVLDITYPWSLYEGDKYIVDIVTAEQPFTEQWFGLWKAGMMGITWRD